jgi:25S rRNA (uracil2634-N3)-methyltransferase
MRGFEGTVLLLGEGNFTFSASIVQTTEGGPSPTLHATSYDSLEDVISKYGTQAENAIQILNDKKCHVIHNVDATNLANSFTNQKFNLIQWNFPHTSGGASHLDVEANRRMLRLFFQSASQFLAPRGRIQVVLRDTAFYRNFKLINQAKAEAFDLRDRVPFKASDFKGYVPVRTNPSKDPSQPAAPDTESASMYIFTRSGPISAKKKATIDSTVAVKIPPELEGCDACGTGRFANKKRKNMHINSAKHAKNVKRLKTLLK